MRNCGKLMDIWLTPSGFVASQMLVSQQISCISLAVGNTTRRGPPGGPRALDTPADFLAAQRAMQRNAMEQQPNEPEQQPSEDLC